MKQERIRDKETTVKLKRQTFTFSRELEFFTERELTAQIGINRQYWADVILKELMDNALDGCENSGIAPKIDVRVEVLAVVNYEDGDIDVANVALTVSDKGSGIPPKIVRKIFDYSTRTSDKEAYRSPTRGQQGNALKTVLAIPFIESGGKEGHITIESQNVRHDIVVKMDAIAQRPVVEIDRQKIVKNGCSVTVYACIHLADCLPRFLQILEKYALFNPHATINAEGQFTPATDPTWQKWTPSDPTSPHWYSFDDFKRLVSACIDKSRNGGRDYTLREFISEFRGLSSTRKQKVITDKVSKIRRLSDLVDGGSLDTDRMMQLFYLMKQETQPVKPDALGIIGEAHFKQLIKSDDAEFKYFCYRHKGDMPFVVEAAFGDVISDNETEDKCFIGINFAPTFLDPLSNHRLCGKFRSEDLYGYGIKGLASEFDADMTGNTLVVHITHPSLIFEDRGKSHLSPSKELANAVGRAIAVVCKEQHAVIKSVRRTIRAEEKQRESPPRPPREVSLKDAVFAVMKEAVNMASDNGENLFTPRSLYYKVRRLIQEYTSKELSFKYFTPDLVTQYEDRFGTLKGLIYERRGHFRQPRSDYYMELDTENVSDYLIPDYEYDKILYVEKEGFNRIFKSKQLGERYDMAIMSMEGFATRAAKQLLQNARSKDITIVVVHDADLAGYDIERTVREETRTTKGIRINVIDFGLHLREALDMGLPSEDVTLKKRPSSEVWNKCTQEEKDFFLTTKYTGYRTLYGGKRIELDAMSTGQLINWIEGKLKEHGLAKKVLPPADVVGNNLSDELARLYDVGVDSTALAMVEEFLGCTIDELASEIKESIGEPEVDSDYYDELRKFLESCPIDYWKDWTHREADKTQREHIEGHQDTIRDIISKRLEVRK